MQIVKPEPGGPERDACVSVLTLLAVRIAANAGAPAFNALEYEVIGRVDGKYHPTVFLFRNRRTGGTLNLDDTLVAYQHRPPHTPANPRSKGTFVAEPSLLAALRTAHTGPDGYVPPTQFGDDDDDLLVPYAELGIGYDGLTDCERLELRYAPEREKRNGSRAVEMSTDLPTDEQPDEPRGLRSVR